MKEVCYMIHQLIASLYNPKVTMPSDERFYTEVLKDINNDSVFSQLYFLMKQRDVLEQTPLFFQKKLKMHHQTALYQNIFIKKQMELLFDLFEEARIETIPLKGVYFAEEYFGHIGARATTDIDLLIRKKDIQQAVHAVKKLGFDLEEEPIPSHFHASFSKMIPGSPYPLTVEIHWDILKETTADLQIEEFWKEARPVSPYGKVKALSGYHTFYMICLHGWRHNLDSPKYYLDIIQMIDVLKGKLPYERLFQDAKRHQTVKRMGRTLSLVYEKYPMLTDIAPLGAYIAPKKKQGQKQGSRFASYAQFIGYQFFSYDTIRHSSVELKLWLLPTRRDLLSQVNQDPKRFSYFSLLSRLYKKRCLNAVKALISIF